MCTVLPCRLSEDCHLAQRNIGKGRAIMHQALGPEVLRPSPNSVVLDRLGLLEPHALEYIHRQAVRVSW